MGRVNLKEEVIRMFKAYKDAMMQKEASGEFKPIKAVCADCGHEFTITAGEQRFAGEGKGFVLPKRCHECRDKRKSLIKHITCADCGNAFEFKVNDQKFYADHGYPDPKRCPECRQKRKSGGNNNGQGTADKDK